MAIRTPILFTLLAALAVPAAAAAQLTINLKGAQTATPVSAVVNGAKQVIGQVGASGSVTLNAAAMNIGKGTRVNVHVHNQGGQSEVVLVPEGQTDPDCSDPQRRNDADCRPVAAIVWGQTAAVTIGLGGAAPVAQTAAGPVGPAKHFRLSLTGEYNHYPNFTSEVGDQTAIQSFTGTNSPTGWGVSLEWVPVGSPGFMVGAGVHYNKQDFSQTFNSSDPLKPVRSSGSVDAWFVNGYAGWVLPYRHYVLHFALGGSIAYDAAEFFNEWLFGPETTASRTNTGLLGHGGIGVDVPLSARFGMRASTNYTTGFKSGSVDDHIGAGLGIWVQF